MKTTQEPANRERRYVEASERGPDVTPEERRKLATCCAFFKAARYRDATPATLRRSDVVEAEHEITEVIEKCASPHEQGRAP